jgi:hypothetical protein
MSKGTLGASRRLFTGVTVSRGHVVESLWHQYLSQEALRLALIGVAYETGCNVAPFCCDVGIPVLIERSNGSLHSPDVERSMRSSVAGPDVGVWARVANFSQKGNDKLPPKWQLYQDALSSHEK